MAENTIERRPHWARRVASVIVGGGVAVFSAPVIYSAAVLSMPIVAATAATCIAVGALGGVSTQGVAELIDAEPTLYVHYNAQQAQARFREALRHYLASLEDPTIDAIRRNVNYRDERTIEINQRLNGTILHGNLARGFKVYIRYAVNVRAVNNGRNFENSAPPPALPTYAEGVVETYELPKNTNYGSRLAWSAAIGASTGTIGALASPLMAGFAFVPTVVTSTMRIGVFVGVPTAAGAGGSIVNMVVNGGSMIDVTQVIELSAEISNHVNVMVKCAAQNGGKLKIDMEVVIADSTKTRLNNDALGNLEILGDHGTVLNLHPRVGY